MCSEAGEDWAAWASVEVEKKAWEATAEACGVDSSFDAPQGAVVRGFEV